MIDFLEAGVGIEPAYTALQAAALWYKSTRCMRLTPGLTPGRRAGHAVSACRLLAWRGLHVSPRTVRKYMPKRPPGRPRSDQRWLTFLRNHKRAIVACDFWGGHGDVPTVLCLGADRARLTSAVALQRDTTPDCSLDAAAAAG